MKTILKSFFVLCCFATLLLTSCQKEEIDTQQTVTENLTNNDDARLAAIMTAEELEAFNEKKSALPEIDPTNLPVVNRGPVTYIAELCGPNVRGTHAVNNSIFNPAFWDYYSFNGTAGDAVTIYVPRTTAAMDVYAEVYFGTVTDSDDLFSLPLIAFADDNAPDPFGSCFADPFIEVVLPFTGTYTLCVADYLGCGSDHGYFL